MNAYQRGTTHFYLFNSITSRLVTKTTLLVFMQLVNIMFNISLAFGQGKSTTKDGNALPASFLQTIVIDAGHGGHDPGCVAGDTHEEDITLAISLKLAELLRQQYPQINVILTRDKDVFIPLYERANIANRNKANLFISIHCNFMPGSSATSGSETFVMGLHTAEHNLNVAKRENDAILLEDNFERNYDYDPKSPEGHIMLSMFQNAFLEQSIRFAEKVERQFAAGGQRKSRGVKQAGFVVLKETTMPSVLIEAGFLSNKAEEQYLITAEGQHQVAFSILQAFHEYKAELEGTAYRPLPTTTPATAAAAPQGPSFRPAVASTPASTPVNSPAPPKPAPAQSTSNQVTPGVVRPAASETYTTSQWTGQPMVVISPQGSIPGTGAQAVNPQTVSAQERSGMPSAGTTTYSAPPAGPAVRPGPAPNPAVAAEIKFGVQIAAASRPMNSADPKLANLSYLVEVVQENQLYKYQIRQLATLSLAQAAKQEMQQRGFADAFILAYRNGQRISVEEAKQLLGL